MYKPDVLMIVKDEFSFREIQHIGNKRIKINYLLVETVKAVIKVET